MYSFFEISLAALNLMSIMIGMVLGLSTGAFNRYRAWWLVVIYLVTVCFYYAYMGGMIHTIIR